MLREGALRGNGTILGPAGVPVGPVSDTGRDGANSIEVRLV